MTVPAAASPGRRWRWPLLCALAAVCVCGSAAAVGAGSDAPTRAATSGAAAPAATAPAPVPADQSEVDLGIDAGGGDPARADASPDTGDNADPDAAAPAIGLDAVAPPGLDNVVTVALRHSAEGLRKTYLDRRGRRKDGMQLPRIIVFNGEGRLLGGQGGFSTGDMRHLRRLVHDDKPFPRAADLEDTLAELETADGAPVPRADLPEADVFLVVYRSADCPRCDRLDAELAVVVRGLHRHRFTWLVAESDPGRVDARPRPASR